MLLISIKQNIATLTLNRPEAHNAIDEPLIQQLTAELTAIEKNPNIRVVILTANGKNFCAGADLHWMQKNATDSHTQNFADALTLANLMKTLYHLNKPTIALIHGATFGGGVGLIACCDIAIATAEASFCLSETKIGLIPAVISPYVIRAISERAARRYFLTAESFDATTALKLGLIHQIVTPDELENTGTLFAKTLLNNSPQAIRMAKNLITDIAYKTIDDNLIKLTAKYIADIRISAEGQEGVKAFLDKRKPNWTNQ